MRTSIIVGPTGAARGAAFFTPVAAVLLLAGGTPRPAMAEQVPCTGPFAQCATAVGGTCERGADGKVMMMFYDRPGGYLSAYEDCVGKVFEAHGKPNPYKPAASQKPAPKR